MQRRVRPFPWSQCSPVLYHGMANCKHSFNSAPLSRGSSFAKCMAPPIKRGVSFSIAWIWDVLWLPLANRIWQKWCCASSDGGLRSNCTCLSSLLVPHCQASLLDNGRQRAKSLQTSVFQSHHCEPTIKPQARPSTVSQTWLTWPKSVELGHNKCFLRYSLNFGVVCHAAKANRLCFSQHFASNPPNFSKALNFWNIEGSFYPLKQ